MANAITNSLAILPDGVTQITFTIPTSTVEREQGEVLAELAKTVTVKGFRKGKAPIDKVKEKIDPSDLTQKVLNKILPKAYTDAILKHKLKPATYPKFELLSQSPTWQVRATLAQIPEFELGEYKQSLASFAGEKTIKGELTKEQKEQLVIKILLEVVKVKIPKMLIDDEVNHRLSDLLARIEKLGLNFDSYLGSVGKTPQSLREEYERQVKDGVSLELILNKIADTRNIDVKESEVEVAIKQAGAHESVAERHLVKSVLRRRAALDQLTTLM